MIIRDASEADAEVIAGYWNPQIRETSITFTKVEKSPAHLINEIRTRQDEGKAFLVACEGGRVVGHATYFQFRSGPGYARTMEHTIVVSPDSWGQGVGRVLMGALETHARAQGAHSLIASISGENTRAIAFHNRIGYHRVATIPETGYKFGRWMDLILMQKLLSATPDNPL